MVILTLETVGDQNLVRGFNRFNAQMKDMRPVFHDLAEYFYQQEEKIFAAQGKPEPFQELSDTYKKWKEAHYPGKKIMELTGRLKESLTAGEGNAGDTIKVIRKQEAEFGSKVPYVHRHQMGTAGMPQRKVIQMTEARKRVMAKMIHTWAFQKFQQELSLHERMVR